MPVFSLVTRSGSTMQPWRPRARAISCAMKKKRSPPWQIAASSASPSRASSATRNFGACRCASARRRWCRGPRLKRLSRLRWPQSMHAARVRDRCVSPTSALAWGDHPGAAVGAAQRLRRRHRYQLAGAGHSAGQRSQSCARASELCRLQYGGGAARTVRRGRIQSALYPVRRHRRACRWRCEILIRTWRSTAEPTGLTITARSRRRARSARTRRRTDRRDRYRSGGTGRRIICCRRPCAIASPQRS